MSTKKLFKKALDPIIGPIVAIYNTTICAIKLVKNAPNCMIYYILDMIGYVIYLPFMLFFWIFGLRSIEKQLWKGINSTDKLVKSVTGYYIFSYPNSIMNKCYRCKNRKDTPGENLLDTYLNDLEDTNPKASFFDIVLFIIIGGVSLFALYYYFNIQK